MTKHLQCKGSEHSTVEQREKFFFLMIYFSFYTTVLCIPVVKSKRHFNILTFCLHFARLILILYTRLYKRQFESDTCDTFAPLVFRR